MAPSVESSTTGLHAAHHFAVYGRRQAPKMRARLPDAAELEAGDRIRSDGNAPALDWLFGDEVAP
jgi:hypothetical protein